MNSTGVEGLVGMSSFTATCKNLVHMRLLIHLAEMLVEYYHKRRDKAISTRIEERAASHAGIPGVGGVRPDGYLFERAPMLFYWELTLACGLACRHCRATAMSVGARENSLPSVASISPVRSAGRAKG